MPTYDGIRVYGGDIVSADDVNANIASVYVKANAESRNTTTTYAADGELVGIPLEVGVYDIECLIFFTMAATAPKLKTNWRFTGTWAAPVRACIGPGADNITVPYQSTSVSAAGFVADSQDSVYGKDTGGVYGVAREMSRNVVISVAGTLALYWAQQNSNASNVTVQPGSHFIVRKIAE